MALVTLAATGVSADVIDGVNVQMQPPDGFVRARAFLGFQQIETYSSIELQELEVPFPELAPQLTPEMYAAKNTLLVGSQSLESGGRKALLLELETELSGTQVNKWVYIIGDALRSISITAAYPRWAAPTMREPLKEAVLSARWLRTWQEQLLYDMPFTVAESASLKFVRRTPNMLILADISETGSLTPSTPAIVVGHLSSDEELIDIKAVSHEQLLQLESIELVEILAEGETKIDGIRSYQIEARVRQNATGATHMFRQVLAFQPFKYLLVHASVDEQLTSKYQPQFDQVIASIAFK